MNSMPDPPAPDPVRLASAWEPVRAAQATSQGRRVTVRIAKYALPALALLLLSTIALWPEWSRTLQAGRVSWKRLGAAETGTGSMVSPRYRGVDARGRPYTVTASVALQHGPERVKLRSPKADLTMPNGAWVLVEAASGLYVQHAAELDLEGGVTLYRQDGTTVHSATATINAKEGAATSNEYTRAEGAFGTLDAEGFTLVDKGGVIQFHGPAKLVLNSTK